MRNADGHFGVFFFFKQKREYRMRISDWISDVCSSVLNASIAVARRAVAGLRYPPQCRDRSVVARSAQRRGAAVARRRAARRSAVLFADPGPAARLCVHAGRQVGRGGLRWQDPSYFGGGWNGACEDRKSVG